MVELRKPHMKARSNMKTQSREAYAKINLFLDVTGKRADGYHDILSVMQSVSLSDTMTVELTDGGFSVTSNVEGVPCDNSNIAVRAAARFFEFTGINAGAKIHIEKRIPMAAGLAGGSTDGAAVIMSLNELTGAGLSDGELIKIASKVGADVPFCLFGGTKITRGIGDVLESCPACPKLHVVVAIDGEGVSTPWAYGELDRIFENFSEGMNLGRINPLLSAMSSSDVHGVAQNTFNIFEAAVPPVRPMVDILKEKMLQGGALSARMSGSGPSVYGLFDSKEKAQVAAEIIRTDGAKAFVCETI